MAGLSRNTDRVRVDVIRGEQGGFHLYTDGFRDAWRDGVRMSARASHYQIGLI